VKKDLVFKIPKEMSFREAAVLPVAYLTAYILLFEIGNIKPNQTILFHSASGGVGVALTQLSKLVPNLTLIATASSHKFEVLRAHIHYLFEHDIDYTEDVKKIAPEGVDLVLDCMAGDDCERGLALLKFNANI
jgi:NADPH:quinone reductase-like Zn-dependent oxidoreductase